ncbi:unnamed protein product [Cylicocyclus nassatus]|uniref:Uncharacterized protein n=1 Tax=Cylicocyclus nassatus TaxID=53992 RepID=A0AA36HDV6_CYLNA|nr:unnamed protein product [Cylicocyclus nassatus]
MVDALADSLTEEQEAQAFEYMEKTQTAIDRAEMLIIQLDARNATTKRRQASQQQSRTPPVRKTESTKQQRGKQTRAHPVSTEIPEENHEELGETQEPRTILHAEEKGTLGRDGSVLLLTGSARIYNTAGKEWTDV